MYKRLFDVLKNLNDFVQKTESSTSAVDPLNTMDKPLGKQNKPGTRGSASKKICGICEICLIMMHSSILRIRMRCFSYISSFEMHSYECYKWLTEINVTCCVHDWKGGGVDSREVHQI